MSDKPSPSSNSAANPEHLQAECHCGLNRLEIRKPHFEQPFISLCHCSTCRYSTGQLFTSYLPVFEVEESIVHENLTGYLPARAKLAEFQHRSDEDFLKRILSQEWVLWFCMTCGSHMYRSSGDLRTGQFIWEVATGVIDDLKRLKLEFRGNRNVLETVDGGMAKWLLGTEHPKIDTTCDIAIKTILSKTKMPDPPIITAKEDILNASCHCGNISFHITRPNESSRLPTSAYSDLIKHLTPQGLGYAENPYDDKWWLRFSSANPTIKESDNPTRYFAGTCVCKSCRKSSGFEIQAWAFVPKTNIFFHVSDEKSSESTTIPLDFEDPRIKEVLTSYSSSEGVTREFCPVCGATVFWRGEKRSDLIDVSVGLLRAAEGARAGSWLEFCGDRVSFMEEVLGEGRSPGEKLPGREALVKALLDGLKAWYGKMGEV